MLVRPVMKRLLFPSKTKEKKARFARAPHDYRTKKGLVLSDTLPLRGTRYVVSRFSIEKCHDRSGLSDVVVLLAHACTEFVNLEPSVIQPRDGKAAELSESVKIEDQAGAVSVRKIRSGKNHNKYPGNFLGHTC